MKKMLVALLILALGAALGRLYDREPPRAEAGGGQGGGVQKCAEENGDVNADGNVDLSDAVTILSFLFLGQPQALLPLCSRGGPSGLPDTGQTLCYRRNISQVQQWEPVPCNTVQSANCPGQDGSYATGCPSEGRFIDNGDGTVTDNCTGLEWQQNTADTNGDGQLNERDSLTWCEALTYSENLNYAGHNDWRLPNVRELQSIVDYGRVNPAIDPVFSVFSGVKDYYWSSTTNASKPGFAWGVNFIIGNIIDPDVNRDSLLIRVLAVRGPTAGGTDGSFDVECDDIPGTELGEIGVGGTATFSNTGDCIFRITRTKEGQQISETEVPPGDTRLIPVQKGDKLNRYCVLIEDGRCKGTISVP